MLLRRPLMHVLCAVGLLGSAAAYAQPGPPQGWLKEFGLGAIVNPKRPGSDRYQFRPIPIFDFRYLDERGVRHFANVPQGLGTYLYRGQSKIGVALAPGFGTRDDAPGLEEIGIATEARLFWERDQGPWRLSATAAADLGTGHEGAYLDLGVSRRGRLGPQGFWSLVDAAYARAQYGIRPEEAGPSGFAAFDAGSGLEQVAISAVVRKPLAGKWSWTAVARLAYLTGDRADSPLVDTPVQGFLLLGITTPF
jgi:outer membrane protein